MKIVIYGTGGVGGYFGAKLALAGEDVVFIARGNHLQAIQQKGLHIEAEQGEIVLSKAQATDDPKKITKADLVIVAVKAWQVTEVAHSIKSMIGSNTLVLPLQNGVEAVKELSYVLGENHILGGLCKSLSWVVKPGYIRSIGQINSISFGELDNSFSKRTEQLKEVFQRAKITAIIPPDINVALWEKFLFVVSFGGVGAVTRSPIGVIRKLDGTRFMLEQSMREVLAIAQHHRVALSDGIIEKSLAFIDSLAFDATTSLHRDITDGKPSELESWNGAVVRLGQQSSIATPLNTFIYNALLPLELKAREKLTT